MADTRTHRYTNNAQSTLAVAMDADDTIITVEDGTGFPAPDADEIFKVTLENLNTGVREICNCTSRTGPALTVERGQEGTTAVAWAAGVVVAHRNTAETMEHLEEREGGGGGSFPFDELAIARARVEFDGSRLDGTPGIDNVAWDCSSPGRYIVTFTNNWFQEPPTCNATAIITGTALIANIEEVTMGGVIIQISSFGGTPTNSSFHLTCIGYAGVTELTLPLVTITETQLVEEGPLVFQVSWTPAIKPGETVLSYEVYKMDSQTFEGAPTFSGDNPHYEDMVFLTGDTNLSNGNPDEPELGMYYINDEDVDPLNIHYAYYVRALTDQDNFVDSVINLSSAPA